MSFLHLHIFNEFKGGVIFHQAYFSQTKNVVYERCSGFWRKQLVILRECQFQQHPIRFVVVHAIEALKNVMVQLFPLIYEAKCLANSQRDEEKKIILRVKIQEKIR